MTDIPRISLAGGFDSVPVIGFGTWLYHGGHGVLVKAAELGCGFVDTAEMYGTEELVGTEIAPVRDRVFLATKVSAENLAMGDLIRHCLGSLERLAVESVDLYQIHWPNPAIPINETMRAMRHLIEQGLIRNVGVSNFSVAQMRDAQAALGDIPLASNQIPYNLLQRKAEEDLIPWCRDHGVLVIAYSPLARFKLGSAAEMVAAVAREVGRTPAQVMLNWAIGTGGVAVIPKTDRIERVAELSGSVGWQLTAGQRAHLEAAA